MGGRRGGLTNSLNFYIGGVESAQYIKILHREGEGGGWSSTCVLQYYSFKMKIKGYFSGVFKFITIL